MLNIKINKLDSLMLQSFKDTLSFMKQALVRQKYEMQTSKYAGQLNESQYLKWPKSKLLHSWKILV
jgi:hypothetical protein